MGPDYEQLARFDQSGDETRRARGTTSRSCGLDSLKRPSKPWTLTIGNEIQIPVFHVYDGFSSFAGVHTLHVPKVPEKSMERFAFVSQLGEWLTIYNSA